MRPILDVKNVSRSYDNVITALDRVTFQINEGEKIALLGSSGCGKSTLLSIIAGFEIPTEGSIFFKNIDLKQWKHEELLTRNIGFLFQNFYLLGHLDPLENVELALFTSVKDSHERRIRSRKLLTEVGMGHRLKSLVRNLSGGERQRVAFCRAVANHPSLLLADEPTGNLDTRSKALLLSMLQEYHDQKGVTLLLATHDPDVAEICDRVIQLEDGRIL